MTSLLKRTIIALVVAIIIVVLLAALQLYMDVITLAAVLIGGIIPNMMIQLSMIFELLLKPYSLALHSLYLPLITLVVAGFVSGLVSKNRVKMLPVSILVIIILFLCYFLLSMAGGAFDFSALLSEIQTMAIDLGIAFFLLFIPGIIGASITQE